MPPFDGVQFVDGGAGCVRRVGKDGVRSTAEMRAGPNGFMLAQFPGESAFETEVPNLVGDLFKRPSSSRTGGIMKRPAGAKEAKAEDEGEEGAKGTESEGEEPEGVVKASAGGPEVARQPGGAVGAPAAYLYKKEAYRTRHKVGIRRKNGDKKQIFTIGNEDWQYERLLVFADSIILELEAGRLSEEEAKKMALETVASG